MRWSRSLIPTLKEDPADAEAISHKLMVRAGMVRQLAAGIYVYLPLGQRVMEKIIAIIREEMNAIGGQEITMPVILPAELWQQSGRWDTIGGGDVPAEGPEPAGHVPGHDPRGGHRLAGRARDPLLPGPAADLVSDPDQGARRGPAQERRAADARVRHEGLLQPGPGRRRPGGAVRGAPAGLLQDLRPLRREVLRGGERSRHDGRGGVARVHGPQPGRRGPGGHLRGVRVRGQRGAGGRPAPRSPASPPGRWRRSPRPTPRRSPRSVASSGSSRR